MPRKSSCATLWARARSSILSIGSSLGLMLEELRLIDEQIGKLNQEMANLLRRQQDAVERLAEVPGLGVDSAQQIIAEVGAICSNLSFGQAALLVGWCMSWRGRECGGELQPPIPEGQPQHAAHSQSGCQRGSQG